MSTTVSDYLIERLRQWDVHRIYGYPGDGINGIMGALDRADGDPEFILARHEELAAFMAGAHAKWTGEVGVCLATSGPGAVHLLNGLYDAKMDHQPVVAIVGQQARMSLGGAYQQEIDLISLFKDVAHEYVQMVTVPEQLPDVVDRAVRIAYAEQTVTCLIFPNDLQDVDAVRQEDLPRTHGMVPGGLQCSPPRVLPDSEDVARAAKVLNEGKRVAILIGQGARRAADEVEQIADKLGAGVAKALLGKDVLPDDLPYVTGSIGLLGTKPSSEMMSNCDTLLMVGTSFPYSEFLPEPGQARGVEIDIDGRMIGMRHPNEVNLVGDAKATLQELLPMIEYKDDRSWRETIEEGIAHWWTLVEERAMDEGDPMNPHRVFWELSPRLPDGCIVSCDSGSSANWYARHLKIRKGQRCSLSGTLATMGPGVPYAIAAKFTHPDKVAIACVGDGAMQMNGINGLITISQYWKRWQDPRLIVCVLANHDLNQVTWEMRAMEGNPKFTASQYMVDFPFAEYARSLGLDGLRIEDESEIGAAWEEALAADRPFVLQMVTDPSFPPLPPHVSWEQGKAMMSALLKHDPDAREIVKRSFQGKVKELL
ncbi:MAG: thiamine pyrophosphate-requiring protein [Acidobacteriota bacterium]|jgi:pyruvate dehydrogenase (quinone)